MSFGRASGWVGEWADSGLAFLTGPPDGPPDFSRSNVLERAQQVAPDAATLLTGRAALLGLTRAGRVSNGGSTRLLEARDGWCAVALSRRDDIAAVPALLGVDDTGEDPWPHLQRWVATRSQSEIVERAELLDIPAAALGEATAAPPRIRQLSPRGPRRGPAGLIVADLSSMWAGPLCGKLLARAGAVVIKVESPGRPDGTRAGQRAFFDWINADKLSYCLDFDRQADQLRELLSVADVVIEGSRPEALTRRHLGPDDFPPATGRIWLRVTGHGADSRRPAFGDDAAIAGGLVGVGPVFCGDAIADPLTGLEAFRTVTESLERGGGELIEVSLAAVAATYAALPLRATGTKLPARPPSPPAVDKAAAALGADNSVVHRLVESRLLPC